MKMVEKATLSERVNHLVLVLSFFVLALTGFGFLFNSLNWLNIVFGGNHLASAIHKWGGLVFAVSLLFSMGNYLGEALSFDSEDREWLRLRGGYFSHAKVPPQGRLNAGQKLYYLTLLVFGVLISTSGLIIWFAAGSRNWMWAGHFFHNLAFVVLISMLPLHVYLATAANPGTFRIMTRGTVPLAWARKRHGKWVKEMGWE